MRNEGTLKPGYRCRMYSTNTVNPTVVHHVRDMWERLTEYELSLLLAKETVAGLFDKQIQESKQAGYMDQKFEEYYCDVDYIYIIESNVPFLPAPKPIAFMAVKGNIILSLFVDPKERSRNFGKYLIYNHLEIYNQPMVVQCYRDNLRALEFYKGLEFKAVDTLGIYLKLRREV